MSPLPMWMYLMFLGRRAHSSHHVWEHTTDMTYSLEMSSDHLAGTEWWWWWGACWISPLQSYFVVVLASFNLNISLLML